MKSILPSLAFHVGTLGVFYCSFWWPGWPIAASFAGLNVAGIFAFKGFTQFAQGGNRLLWFPPWVQVAIGSLASVPATFMAIVTPIPLGTMLFSYLVTVVLLLGRSRGWFDSRRRVSLKSKV